MIEENGQGWGKHEPFPEWFYETLKHEVKALEEFLLELGDVV